MRLETFEGPTACARGETDAGVDGERQGDGLDIIGHGEPDRAGLDFARERIVPLVNRTGLSGTAAPRWNLRAIGIDEGDPPDLTRKGALMEEVYLRAGVLDLAPTHPVGGLLRHDDQG